DRVPRRLQSRKQSLAPSDERFTLLGSAPDVFASMTSYLDQAALRQGFAYKDVVQPFVIGGWAGLGGLQVVQGPPGGGGGGGGGPGSCGGRGRASGGGGGPPSCLGPGGSPPRPGGGLFRPPP